ncbi:MAG TPA: glycosyltransferase family 1 protein [Stenomitos sp.]
MINDEILVNLSVLFSKPTGISTYAINLFPHLQPLNPTLLISPSISRGLPLTANYTCYPIPGHLTPEQGTKGHLDRLLWTQLQLPQIYKRLRSRLVFSPIPEAPLYTNCRSVVVVHDLIPLRFPRRFSPLTPYFRYYIPQVLAQAEHIICDSLATAKDITDFFHIPSAKITPILLAYDANHFRPLPSQPSGLMEEYMESRGQDAASHRPYFLYIGRPDPHKNLQRLIDAFAALPNCRDYELWLVGSTDQRYTPKLKAQAEQLGLAEQVKVLDYLPYNQLPLLFNQAIALVFPTLWEGFGLPVLEAMACGTPVITSNLSSLPEVAGDAAVLVNPYNTGEITDAMQAVATDFTLRSRLRTLSLNRASQFSWAKTGQATVEVLQRYL